METFQRQSPFKLWNKTGRGQTMLLLIMRSLAKVDHSGREFPSGPAFNSGLHQLKLTHLSKWVCLTPTRAPKQIGIAGQTMDTEALTSAKNHVRAVFDSRIKHGRPVIPESTFAAYLSCQSPLDIPPVCFATCRAKILTSSTYVCCFSDLS